MTLKESICVAVGEWVSSVFVAGNTRRGTYDDERPAQHERDPHSEAQTKRHQREHQADIPRQEHWVSRQADGIRHARKVVPDVSLQELFRSDVWLPDCVVRPGIALEDLGDGSRGVTSVDIEHPTIDLDVYLDVSPSGDSVDGLSAVAPGPDRRRSGEPDPGPSAVVRIESVEPLAITSQRLLFLLHDGDHSLRVLCRPVPALRHLS